MSLRSALLLSLAAAASVAAAAPYSFVTWDKTTQTATSIHGSIPTDLGPIGVDVVGDFDDILTNYPSWDPATSFAGGVVDNAPDTDMLVKISHAGHFAVSFSQEVHDAAVSMWSVGQGNVPVTYSFDRAIDLVAGGPSAEYGGSSLVQSGNAVTGAEGNGTVTLGGSMTGFGIDVIHDENYHGFTIGLQHAQAVPEPAPMAACGSTASARWAS